MSDLTYLEGYINVKEAVITGIAAVVLAFGLRVKATRWLRNPFAGCGRNSDSKTRPNLECVCPVASCRYFDTPFLPLLQSLGAMAH